MVARGFVLLFFGLGLVLAGCGGGGGGGNGEASGAASTPVAPADVSIKTDPTTNSKLLANISMDSPAPVMTVRGVVQGNAGALSGKTIYAVVEDKENLLQGTPKVLLDPNSTLFGIELVLRAQQEEGLRRGTFRVFACLDPECKAQLQGSPLSYDYEFKWIRPMRSSIPSINATRVYGSTDEVRVAFSVTAPKDGTLSARMAPYTDPDFQVTTNDPRFALSWAKVVGSPDWAFDMKFEPAAPGIHTSSVYTDSTEPGVGGPSWPNFLNVPVRYEVLDNPAIALAFSPAGVRLSMSLSAVTAIRLPEPLEFRSLLKTGDTLQFKSIRYLSAPPSAATLPFGHDWLRVDNWSGNVNQTSNRWVASIAPPLCNVESVCLPAGTYTALALFNVQRPTGAIVEVGYPVTFEIRN